MSEKPSFIESGSSPRKLEDLEIIRESQTVRTSIESEIKREYTPHLLDNPKVEVKKIPELGRAVLARENIKSGEIIAAFVGKTYRAKKISELPNDAPDFMRDHVIQIGEEEYLYGKNGLAELINHSCDPNCGIKGKSMIVAMRDISSGEQLTWDYAMTEDSDWFLDGCLCGSDQCLGSIGPYRNLSPEKKIKYWNYTSEWLKKKYPKILTESNEVRDERYSLQTVISESEELTEELLWEITWFFWWLFANDFAGQFLFYPSEKKPISAQKAFGIIDDTYIPMNQLQSFSPKNFPKHPQTREEAKYWVDPETTFKRFQEKFSKKTIITLLRDEKNTIIGFTFGRRCTILEAFQSEEWENPVYYSASDENLEKRDFDTFINSINHELSKHPELIENSNRAPQLSPDSEVFVWNCIGVSKEAHGKGHFWKLTTEFFRHLPLDDRNNLWNIAEAVVGNTAYKLFKRARTIDVAQALGNNAPPQVNDGIVIITPLEDFARIFSRENIK